MGDWTNDEQNNNWGNDEQSNNWGNDEQSNNWGNDEQSNNWGNNENSEFYKNIDYKNEWLDENKNRECSIEPISKKNELYDKLGLCYNSFFEGPKLFHSEQSKRKNNL